VTQHPAIEAVQASTPGAQIPGRLAEIERMIRVAMQQLGWTAARGYRATALTIGAGYTQVPLDAASYGGEHFTGGNYVVPIAGAYQMLAQAAAILPNTGDDNDITLALGQNSNVVSYGTTVVAPVGVLDVDAAVVGGDIIQCAAGDTLELWVYFTGSDPTAELRVIEGVEASYNFLAVARVG
jgi:hypothetical protein